ncbi:hypothetical protein EYF80_068239 [Liparis tanakae]|uniref:Uncharacterized protein n=1 Tax=Liparis tanakae TaxID=230148 RepID=A0A4Z2DYY3_9TELE|nr:hypothetical protein EYF80_068239 [Liparis tanakae]
MTGCPLRHADAALLFWPSRASIVRGKRRVSGFECSVQRLRSCVIGLQRQRATQTGRLERASPRALCQSRHQQLVRAN